MKLERYHTKIPTHALDGKMSLILKVEYSSENSALFFQKFTLAVFQIVTTDSLDTTEHLLNHYV